VNDDGPVSMYMQCTDGVYYGVVNNGYVGGMMVTTDSIGEGTLSWMR